MVNLGGKPSFAAAAQYAPSVFGSRHSKTFTKGFHAVAPHDGSIAQVLRLPMALEFGDKPDSEIVPKRFSTFEMQHDV